MESKQLLFEDKAQQICVKGDIIHNTDELELLTRKINKLNQIIIVYFPFHFSFLIQFLKILIV